MKPRWQSVKEDHTEGRPTILLMEGEDELRESRRLLLSCVSTDVRVVNPASARVNVEQSTCVAVIVIPLGPVCQTEELAYLARRQWPKARILLVGKICDVLQDALYDEVVDACCNPVGFVEVSRRLLGQYVESNLSGNIEGHGQA